MIKCGEDELVCDLAETYGIYDYRSLPLRKVAAFSVGLRNDSRIKMKMSGMNVSLDTMLMAMMVDSLATLVWTKTDDCAKRMNRPKSMVQLLLNSHDEETETFDTAEDFEKARLEIIRS